ncbi:hypothetical protein [Burkholderia ubonensis]|nr:hypothetical protein [Burkholderia ubonensis]
MEDYIGYGDVVRFINGYQGGSYLGAGAGRPLPVPSTMSEHIRP